MEEDEQQVCGRMGVFLPVCIFVCLCFSFVYMYIIILCEYIVNCEWDLNVPVQYASERVC